MATTAPFVKLLRQLSAARDDYRTGALDITWDGGTASLFLVFGQPNHATLEGADGRRLEGQEALTALVHRLPPRFQISPWRKAVVRTETLKCSLDDLIEPFAQLAGAASPVPLDDAAPHGSPSAGADPSGVDFGLDDFPLLPLGTSLWADAAASVVHLDVLLPSLPDALVVLTGPRLRAAGVVIRHRLVDAVWIDEEDRLAGDEAAMALIAAGQGSVSGYALDQPELAETLTMLWRCPVAHRAIPALWIRPDDLLDDLERHRRDCAIVVTGGVRGVALLSAGRLVAVYSEEERQPLASRERFAELLGKPGASITIRQNADERQVEHLPEASFHAFVEPVADATAPIAAETAAEPAGTAASVSNQAPQEALAALFRVGEAPRAAELPPAAAPAWAPPPPPPPPLQADQAPAPAAPAWIAGLEAHGPAEYDPTGVDTGAAPPSASGPAPVEAPPSISPGPAVWDLATLGAGPDYEGVKRDLIQIGTLWLGADAAVEPTAMIERARPTVEDIMSTIDAITSLPIPEHEPSVVQAMAREMRFHAAEYLSGL